MTQESSETTVGPFALGSKHIEAVFATLTRRLTGALGRLRGANSLPAMSSPDPAALFEALNRLLRLADLLPAGASGDRVRRCVCELIEAGADADRNARLRLLVTSLTDLQRNDNGRHPGESGVSSAIERLLNAVRSEVIPILQPGYRASMRTGSARRAGAVPSRDEVEAVEDR